MTIIPPAMPTRLPVVLGYNNSNFRGPGKVVQNLEKGLTQLGIGHGAEHAYARSAKFYHGILQPLPDAKTWWSGLNSNVLAGPNLFVIPSDWPLEQIKAYKHYVVPSRWVHDLYRTFRCMDHATIDVWPVGIDTDRWKSCAYDIKSIGPINQSDLKCLLYFKNRNVQDLELVKKILGKYGIASRVLEYGSYSEEQMQDVCSWANMGILLTDTESQGIAYMEMLSSDLPLFVFNKSWWESPRKDLRVSATSVPYFDARCGEVSDNVDLKLFEKFLNGVMTWKYRPRSYILENHTLELAAQRYYDLLVQYESLVIGDQ